MKSDDRWRPCFGAKICGKCPFSPDLAIYMLQVSESHKRIQHFPRNRTNKFPFNKKLNYIKQLSFIVEQYFVEEISANKYFGPYTFFGHVGASGKIK